MNIDTSSKDVIDAPLGSNGSKGSFGSDDSLEYSNDDRSTAKTIDQDKAGDKINDKYLPPKHPSSIISIVDQHDTNLFTPKRKQNFEVNADRLPGPLNLFSPGLSPIGHTNYSRYDDDDDKNDVSEFERVDVGKEAEVEARGTYNTELRDSVDSLDMASLRDDKNRSRNSVKEDNRPNYQFWKNKLFANDLEPSVTEERVSPPKIPPIVFPTADNLQHRSYIRSSSNSFDSDFNLTPRQHSLVYPTTDALYERSAAVTSPQGANLSVSRDSSLHTKTGPGQQQQQQHQFVMYPASVSLEARSPHHRMNRSMDRDEAHIAMQSLMSPGTGTPHRHEEGTPRNDQLRHLKSPQQQVLNSPGSANGSMDSDLHVTKQSLVYPTTRAVYEKSSRPGDDVSVDSDMRAISKQSLVYPTTAALFRRSGDGSPNTTLDSDVSFAHQSYLLQNNKQVAVDRGQVDDSLGHISMLDRSVPVHTAERYPTHQSNAKEEEGYSYGHFQYEYAEEDALGQSLHSISLLPGSPVASLGVHSSSLHAARIPSVGTSNSAKRTSNLLFPPSYPHSSASPTAAAQGKTPLLGSPPESATSSRRTATHASNSDSEFVRSATKKRELGTSKAGNIWKEAEDLAPSNFTSLSKGSTKDTRSEPPQQSVAASATAGPAATRQFSPPSAPSSPSSVSGGSPFAGRMYTHGGGEASAGVNRGALMEGSLVVGGLYTLQVDSHGRPAFVPVVLNSQASNNNATGVTFSSPPVQVHAPSGGATSEWTTSHHTFSATPQPFKETPRYASPPSSGRRLYEGPAHEDVLGLSPGANSNHVDVHMVLERALHHGSLSEEKVARRWNGDTSKRNSPPAAVHATAFDKCSRHGHQQALLPTTPQRTSAQHFHPTTTPASSVSSLKQKKSPYRLVVGMDGQEHLQPSAEYYKERLLQRSLTSVLQSPAGAASGGRGGLFGRLLHSPPISTFT